MFKTIKCKSCGASSFKKIGEDVYQCKYCGMQIHKNSDEDDEIQGEEQNLSNDEFAELAKIDKLKNSKKGFILTKLLLCIFFGQFGVHRFMEGKIFSGLVYCFTQGLFGIGVFVDIIKIAKELSGVNKEEEE